MKLQVWTRDNCERLRHWWEEDGLPASQVSAKFGQIGYNITRNAVIGKVYRMGLVEPEKKAGVIKANHSQRAKILNTVRAERKEQKVAYQRVDAQGLMEVRVTMNTRQGSTAPPDGGKAVLLKHSKDGQCKAILGYIGGRAEDALYCGEDCASHTTSAGRVIPTSYCPYHKSIYMTEPRR
jgi:hypothetical protein